MALKTLLEEIDTMAEPPTKKFKKRQSPSLRFFKDWGPGDSEVGSSTSDIMYTTPTVEVRCFTSKDYICKEDCYAIQPSEFRVFSTDKQLLWYNIDWLNYLDFTIIRTLLHLRQEKRCEQRKRSAR